MNHTWVLQKREAGHKLYACSKCEAGPVRISELIGKGNITQNAKKQGIDPDCKMEIVKSVNNR